MRRRWASLRRVTRKTPLRTTRTIGVTCASDAARQAMCPPVAACSHGETTTNRSPPAAESDRQDDDDVDQTGRARARGAGRAAIPAKTLRTDRWWFEPAYTVVGPVGLVDLGHDPHARDQGLLLRRGRRLPLPDAVLLALRLRRRAARGGGVRPVRCRTGPLVPYAAVSLPFLLLFRLTCYYYRRAYYRSFWLSPPACAVPDGHKTLHRRDPVPARLPEPAPVRLLRRRADLAGQHLGRDPCRSRAPSGFGFGLGNVILLVATWCCCGRTPPPATPAGTSSAAGSSTSPSTRVRYRAWTFVSKLNTRHKELAWITLGTLRAGRHLHPGDLRRLVPRPAVHQLRA